jgi:hypothetical protein
VTRDPFLFDGLGFRLRQVAMNQTEQGLMSDPFQEPTGISYRDAIVTFIDILGFQSFVTDKSADQVASAIARLQQSVQSAPAGARRRTAARAIRSSRVHAFSDCVVRVRPFDNTDDQGPTFIRELADLASIQASLAGAGVFVRGGVTIDKVHSSETVVFGPGLIRAYKLENELAHVPRIIVDPAAIQRFRERPIPKSRMRSEITSMRRSIRQADDGLWFVDYLRAGAAALGEEAAIRSFLKQHRVQVTDAATAVDVASSVLPKYLWAAKYHNASCARILKSPSIPGVTISKTQLPSFERLRLPVLLSR